MYTGASTRGELGLVGKILDGAQEEVQVLGLAVPGIDGEVLDVETPWGASLTPGVW